MAQKFKAVEGLLRRKALRYGGWHLPVFTLLAAARL